MKSRVKSESNMHVIIASKRSVAIGALARARGETFFDAVIAENMTASLDDGILEVPTTDRAKGKRLYRLESVSTFICKLDHARNLPVASRTRRNCCQDSCLSNSPNSSWCLKATASNRQSRSRPVAAQKKYFLVWRPWNSKAPSTQQYGS